VDLFNEHPNITQNLIVIKHTYSRETVKTL